MEGNLYLRVAHTTAGATDAEVAIPDEAKITTELTSSMKLLGSFSSMVALRPRDGEGDPGDGDPPPPPPPPVSTPDLAFQFSPCLPANLQDAVIGAVRSAIDPNADVRALCLNDTERLGIWLRPAVTPSDSDARNQGMQRINVLKPGETFAFFINSALIRSKAQDVWNNTPKRLNGDGQPDPGGPVHLTSFGVSFESPNRVVTTVGGFDERPWPDVNFTFTVTDTLSTSGGEIQCQSSSHLDVDTSWINYLTAIFLAGGIFLSPWLLIPGGIFLTEGIIIGSIDAPDSIAGAGCSAAQLLPREILIPGGLKVLFTYSQVEVGAGGIFAGGSYLLVPRNPNVSIVGPTQIAEVEGTSSVRRSYSYRAQDLRAPIQVHWSADGSVSNSGAPSTSISFNIDGSQAGQVLTRQVYVDVLDADSLGAHASVAVRIHVTEDSDDSGVCLHKPWLPQCQ